MGWDDGRQHECLVPRMEARSRSFWTRSGTSRNKVVDGLGRLLTVKMA